MYSNWGPLCRELEQRLAGRLRLPAAAIASASSGTAALVGAILAVAGRAKEERPLALVPALTFSATAIAVEQCGYRPRIVDVDETTWMLDPERLIGHAELDRIGLVAPVAPFGRPVPQEQWRAFSDATSVPVVIDGAASFDRLVDGPEGFVGEIPVAISFHATKSFSTGEGGCVASANTELAARAAQALNFGFRGTRETTAASINGKMSEYHAAVGLAELDGWSEKRLALTAAAELYRRGLATAGIPGRLVATPEIGVSYVLFRCDDADEAARVTQSLSDSGVDHRLWYDLGLQHHRHFSGLAGEKLPVTERLAPCLLGVPLAPDLTEATVAHVVDALVQGVERRA
jgi:dTDP-4-amino-4,6-dideoxygalactose transaminase